MADSSFNSDKIGISVPPLSSYDVYLSYRNTGTTKIFVDHLCTALKSDLISTIYCDSELGGDALYSLMPERIKQSKIVIVVLSENYASSEWCLDELVEILGSKRKVVVIFYHVDPVEVSHQTGEFGTAFTRFKEMENSKVGTWKAALTSEIRNLSGYHLPQQQTRYVDKLEPIHITKIVENVKRETSPSKLVLFDPRKSHDRPPPISVQKIVQYVLRQDLESQNSNSSDNKLPVYDDGFKWRRYGTKKILNTEHPRIYYRCTSTNCAARKQVQSVDSQVIEIVNVGLHNHHPPQSSKDGNATGCPDEISITRQETMSAFEESFAFLLSAENQGWSNNDKLTETRIRERNEDEPDAKRRMEAQIDFPVSEYTLFDINELVVLMEDVLECKLPKSKSVVVRCLKVMHIRNSNLSDIPDNLSFPDLENLFLQSKIDSISIPSSIFERMPALRVLDMSNTSIRTLPASFSKLIKLEKLLLHGCQSLKELPQEICAIVTLNFLDLSGCTNLAEIPESIALLESLSSLNLTDCISLTKLPESITKLRSLKYFYISGCSSLLEFHTPEVSLHTISPSSQTDEMEVLLDFHKSEGTLHDITELLALLEKVAQYEFMKSKSLAVRSLKVIHIRNSKLPDIPDNLSFPDLEELFLQSNLHKSHIPSSFFKQMPALKVLDMSNTSIQTLPPPVSELFELEQLILRHCELLMELPPEIGALRNLRVLDLEGTNLVCLPDELKELTNLNCLKVSLYDAENYRKSKRIVAIIPAAIVSKLTQLEELSIDVDPQDVWCSAAMKVILEDLPSLRMLKTLKLYLPTTELLQNLLKLTWNDGDLPIYQNVLNFNVIVGPRSQHFISRIPCDLEEEFLRLKKCLKYINGKEDTTQIAEALEHANALYLDRHWTIQNLSLFNLEVSKKLKFCLLVDCNEMKMIFDGGNFNHGAANKGANLLSMQYLAIHYLKNLEIIWNGPGVGICLQTLKVLTLHMCPNLKTVFTPLLLGNLQNLKEIIVEDCPKITSLIAEDSTHLASQEALLGLKKLSLLYLPELVSISSGISIGPELENIVIYDCPNLKRLPLLGMRNKEVVKIKGEGEWWNALEWKESEWSNGQPQYLHHVFSELDIDGDFLDELATQYVNSLRLFVEECNAN
ncbi:uncharacterized protein LOC141667660 [Apium graveolens]|uniref:uncharacterized protein LOC141667660 n=1 Tax=Apium graveolens TaxID=4045 RepID=UPI003D7A2933